MLRRVTFKKVGVGGRDCWGKKRGLVEVSVPYLIHRVLLQAEISSVKKGNLKEGRGRRKGLLGVSVPYLIHRVLLQIEMSGIQEGHFGVAVVVTSEGAPGKTIRNEGILSLSAALEEKTTVTL